MGAGSDQIETAIDMAVGQLGENLGELENKVKSATDWRAQFERRPGVMVAAAFTGGVLLALLARGLLGGFRER